MKAKQLVVPCIASAMLATLPFTPLGMQYRAMAAVEEIADIVQAVDATDCIAVDSNFWMQGELSIGSNALADLVFTDGSYETIAVWEPDYTIAFGVGDKPVVSVDCRDGSVTFGAGVTTNEASLAFWRYVEAKFPEMFERKAVSE